MANADAAIGAAGLAYDLGRTFLGTESA